MGKPADLLTKVGDITLLWAGRAYSSSVPKARSQQNDEARYQQP
jgi:hypothetical protein